MGERRRRDKDAVVERKKVVNPDTGETPEGYNKMLRDCARIALAGSSAALLGGLPQIALVASAIAAGLLQQGTTYSIKNWKWTAVSWCLLPACLTAWFAVHRGDDRPGPRLLHLYHFCDGRTLHGIRGRI